MVQHSNKPSDPSGRRLVVTLGPSSFSLAKALADAGATEFRLNASHMSVDDLAERCAALRRDFPKIRCVVDLQGKKMRIGAISARQLAPNMLVTLSNDPDDDQSVYVPHSELFAQVAIGEHLSLDDGRIEIEIEWCESRRLQARVRRAGLLKPRKGLNRVEHPLELFDLTAADQSIVSRCAQFDNTDFAVSFAEDGTEAEWIRTRAPARRVILKVERREALLKLPSLVAAADELWICRGDLGAQLGLAQMADAVASIRPNEFETPTLMAGQVLEHVRTHDTPTRSEVCHLSDLLQRGYAGVVLSDETAIGDFPELATRWAATLMHDFMIRG